MGIKKTRILRWFQTRWKSFEKMHQKKLLAKKWKKCALFSLLLMIVKLVLLITFSCAFFLTIFSIDSKSAWNSAFLIYFFYLKKCFLVILALFENFEAKGAKHGYKNLNSYYVNVSWISILHPSKGLCSSSVHIAHPLYCRYTVVYSTSGCCLGLAQQWTWKSGQ